MNFKSQICTTKEQSKRLIDLGLDPNTADMFWLAKSIREVDDDIEIPEEDRNYFLYVNKDNSFFIRHDFDYIPAWSLHRLMEIGNITGVGFPEIDNIYEVCIRIIASKIKFKLIDPEYINN